MEKFFWEKKKLCGGGNLGFAEGSRYPDKHYIQANFLLDEYEGEIKLMEPELYEGWEYFDFNSLPVIFSPHQKIIEAYLEKKFYLM
jgi:hypothetical protein